MARETYEAARRERNRALVETMLLAASADGRLEARELQVLIARVIERPEFEGTDAEALNAMLEEGAKRLASARSLDEVLKRLTEWLPEHRNRLLAFGLAAAVAFGDRRATREELGLLKTVQAAFGISEDEVQRVIDVVERGESLTEVLGEPPEHLFAETMVLVGAADGVVRESELLSMFENLAGDPVFRDVSRAAAETALRAAIANLAAEGLPNRLAALARGLTTRVQRRKAYQLGVRIANAAGAPGRAEVKVLELLQATFGLSDDDVKKLSAEA
ncbi:MAG: tellurite resistance TerB family protein [Myxococcaceae bacterium]|nr:tellurite resistance TerB family protein [Myxococcaceae bacterium]MCA3015882.1 tellurite resistance TerB family protein [Myxococcaceae bacterium]